MAVKVILQICLQEEIQCKLEARVLYKALILEILTALAKEYCHASFGTMSWDISAQIMVKLARRAKKLLEHKKAVKIASIKVWIDEILQNAWSFIDKTQEYFAKQWHTKLY